MVESRAKWGSCYAVFDSPTFEYLESADLVSRELPSEGAL